MFVDRQLELGFLNELLTRKRPGPAQLILLYGRRRVGKSELLLHWAQQSGLPFTYWEAVKETANQQRNRLFAKLLQRSPSAAPTYRSWPEFWDEAAPILQAGKQILILDEIPYMAEADSAMLSALQYVWDQYFQRSELIMVLCGSQVRMMETLLSRQSPLFGRMTGQWHLAPLPFSSLAEFFPTWGVDERVAAYAMVGGIPAYLNWLNPDLDLVGNLRQVILKPGNIFLAEPALLLYDEVREPNTYLGILKAIGAGAHTLTEIGERAFIPVTSVNFYLNVLQELRLVERRLPVTQPKAKQLRARNGRYHLSDPYFRFYFQFLEPFLSAAPLETERVIEMVRQNLRAFVGRTAFEALAQQWIWHQARAGQFPFSPEAVGSHWSRRVQVDVVALNWHTHEIFLGECKWGGEPVDLQVARELLERKTPLLLRDLPEEGQGWKVFHGLFARQGFTPAAAAEMQKQGGLVVDLPLLDQALGRA